MKDLFNHLTPGEQKQITAAIEAHKVRREIDEHHPNGEFCPVRFECPHGMQICQHFMCSACALVTEYTYGANPNPKRSFLGLTWRRKRGTHAVRQLARKLSADIRYSSREAASLRTFERDQYGAWSDDGSNRSPKMADAQARVMHGSWGAGEGMGYATREEKLAAGKWVEPEEVIDHVNE